MWISLLELGNNRHIYHNMQTTTKFIVNVNKSFLWKWFFFIRATLYALADKQCVCVCVSSCNAEHVTERKIEGKKDRVCLYAFVRRTLFGFHSSLFSFVLSQLCHFCMQFRFSLFSLALLFVSFQFIYSLSQCTVTVLQFITSSMFFWWLSIQAQAKA